jgi:protein SCO1
MSIRPYHLALAAFCLAVVPVARGHSEHAEHAGHATQAAPDTISLNFRDTALTDQNGKSVRLKSDVLGDRLVIMDFVYTSCTTVCPVVSAVLAQVQEKLGPRLGKEVALVSVTVDPQRDTPARLKTYSAKHGARSGWSWLTGSPANVNEVLKSAGTYTPNFEDHPVVILIGDPRTGQWTRHYGFADPKDLLARVDALALARRAPASATARKE